MGKTTTTRRKRNQPMSSKRRATAALRQKLGKVNYGKRRSSGAISKFTKRPNQIETKTMDLLFTGAYAAAYTPDTVPLQTLNTNNGTACVQALNLIQQGPGTSQRIGHKVSLKSLRLKGSWIVGNAVATLTPYQVRLMVIYDHNPDGAYTAANQILGSITQANVVSTGIASDSLNPNFFERMVVLMDKWITLPPYNAGALSTTSMNGPSDQVAFCVDEYVSLKNLEVVYGNTSNGLATANPMTIAYIQSGALYIVSYGLNAAASCPYQFYGSARLRFRDN